MIEQDIFDIEYFNNALRDIRLNRNKGTAVFFEKYQQEIIRIIYRISKSTSLANVVVNNVLISIWRFAEKKKFVKNPHGFLYVVVANHLKDTFKARKNFEPLNDFIMASEDYIERVVAEDKFNYLLGKLNDEERDIVINKIKMDMTFQEISHLKNKPISTVSSIFYRAIKKIEKKFFKK